jgi:phytanoyl-CoA dioxygenase PhyH
VAQVHRTGEVGLTTEQQDEFRTTGLLRLEGEFPRAAAEAMGERLWEFLASRDGIVRGERSTWTIEKPAGFQSVTRSGAFWAVSGDRLCAALDGLFGAGRWARPRWWGRPLVTFPADGPWELPAREWHFDFMPAVAGHRPVQFFAFLSPVRPRGGGTLVLTGSHRLVAPYLDGGEEFRMPRVRAALAAHPWLRGLWEPGHGGDRVQRYMNDGTVLDGVPLRVVELTGEPGDVVLMHSDCFHAPAPNRLNEPRMMLTEMIAERAL